MKPNPLGQRHIHLDFHTSELIEGIGKDFDAERFARTLADAHVDSITLFTRCHHGMLYYDSKLYPENVHPHLVVPDMLEQQAAACHSHGIDVNLYTSVCWDKKCVDEHPEWVCIDANGALQDFKGKKYFEAGFYKNLCVNTGYRAYLKAQFKEALESIPAEGVWFDAAFINECCCPTCIAGMKEQGLDPRRPEDRTAYSLITYQDFIADISAFVREINPKYNITYNKGHVGVREKAVRDGYTYYAIESLPGGEWGYMDFPVSSKYNRNFGKPVYGMTGRFHTEWGDFSSFRNQQALEYECFSMLANGCGCIIGDQLDPGGALNPYMYERIGKVFAEVERKQPWCKDVEQVVEIGLFTEEEFFDNLAPGEIPKATEGAARLLMELSQQFDIVDSESDFSRYRLLILPDSIPVSEAFARKLHAFVQGGGKLLATYHAGLNPSSDAFAVEWGATYLGEAPYSPDFILPKGALGEGLPPSEHVMYSKGALVEAKDQGQILLETVTPVFNRTWEHFCSHLHSPSSGKVEYPAAIGTENTLYFIHPLFSQYQRSAPPWYKTLVRNALSRLLPEPLVRHDGPNSLVSNVMAQEGESRWVLHLLHYIPERKCDTLDIVDQVIPLHDISLALRCPDSVQAVRTVPEGEALPFTREGDILRFTLPKLTGHQMVEVSWK